MTADAIELDSQRDDEAAGHGCRNTAGEHADYQTARRFLTLLQSRQEQFRASRGRAVDFSRMQGGRSRHRGPVGIDPLERWILNIGWLLGSLGHKGAYVLTARVTRRPKSAEASWKQIAHEVDDTTEEVKRVYQYALACFILLIEMNRISTDLRDSSTEVPMHLPERCAAAEAGEACTVAPAA